MSSQALLNNESYTYAYFFLILGTIKMKFGQMLVRRNMCKVSAKNIELWGSWISSKFSNFQTKYLVSQKQ